MTAQLDHTIVWCRDGEKSARFLAELLDLPEPTRFGPFRVVELGNGVSLDYSGGYVDIAMQHYAFLVSEAQFDATFGRLVERGLPYWADPGKEKPGEINRHDGGRGVYWDDPDGHKLEIITRPYGSGGA